MWDLGSQRKVIFEKSKILVQIKAPGIYKAGLPFELHVSVTAKGVIWALWQRQQKIAHQGFWCKLYKGAETQYSPEEQQLAAYTVLILVEPLTKKQQSW